MASIDELTRLFRVLAAEDWERAKSLAFDIADGETQKGHHTAAQILRGALNPNGTSPAKNGNGFIESRSHVTLLSDALAPAPNPIPLDSVMLRPRWKRELLAIVEEWQKRDGLREKGIRRRTKLFFFGPPGCGKSLAARAIGHAMSLPTYVVRFDAIIGAYLGQTAIHLRELFRFAVSTPCVLLFDEIDALGKRRGNPLDVGELDRIVISMMQELEHSEPAGIVIATSNMPKYLDDALWRRFDLIVEFPIPSKSELHTFGKNLAAIHSIRLPPAVVTQLTSVKSYAEAEKLIQGELRRHALREL
jgi:AAA+ superfamily predicted ATPase